MEGREIFEAIESGDLERVRGILATDPGAGATRDEAGLSALIRAVYRGDQKIVEALVAGGPGLDVWEAAAVGSTERVQELLHDDPDRVGRLSPDGFSPLHLAAFFGHPEVVELLLDCGAPLETYAQSDFAKVTPLGSAAAAGQTAVARRLLDAGANANARSLTGGFTPLHVAAANGDAELAKALLQFGALPDAATDDGRTARDLAAGNEQVLAVLV